MVEEIDAAGGEAMANGVSVTDAATVAMVAQAKERWGRIDILIDNAGVLRDRTFAKMEPEDFRDRVDVHPRLGQLHQGRVGDDARPELRPHLMTTSSTGLYGNFGQANYGAAKLASSA